MTAILYSRKCCSYAGGSAARGPGLPPRRSVRAFKKRHHAWRHQERLPTFHIISEGAPQPRVPQPLAGPRSEIPLLFLLTYTRMLTWVCQGLTRCPPCFILPPLQPCLAPSNLILERANGNSLPHCASARTERWDQTPALTPNPGIPSGGQHRALFLQRRRATWEM